MDQPHPRSRRTREAILSAFATLVLARRYDSIRTADLIAAAGVGRSTFYEHFRSKEAVLLAAVEPILHTLASAALGRAGTAQVRAMLDHVWAQRGVARLLLEGRTGDRLQRRIAAMIIARHGDMLPAMGAAAAQSAMLRLWLRGEAACPAAELARHLRACRCLLEDPVKEGPAAMP